jgi:uncharacterized membrane protein
MVTDTLDQSAHSANSTVTVTVIASVSVSFQMKYLNGNVSSSFPPGTSIVAEAVITNTGTTAINNAFIVVTFKNPDSTVIFIGYDEDVSLGVGQQQTVGLGTTLSTNSVVGTYAVGVIVYTAQPPSGGTVISGGTYLGNFNVS